MHNDSQFLLLFSRILYFYLSMSFLYSKQEQIKYAFICNWEMIFIVREFSRFSILIFIFSSSNKQINNVRDVLKGRGGKKRGKKWEKANGKWNGCVFMHKKELYWAHDINRNEIYFHFMFHWQRYTIVYNNREENERYKLMLYIVSSVLHKKRIFYKNTR